MLHNKVQNEMKWRDKIQEQSSAVVQQIQNYVKNKLIGQ